MDFEVCIVNYSMGNLGSIQNMLKKLGHSSVITSELKEIEKAGKLILPGVGHFDRGMEQLKALGLIDALNKKVLIEKTPVLGICLGMQLMGNKSEEGNKEGLKWVDANFIKFQQDKAKYEIRIPQMTWNYVKQLKPSKLLEGIPNLWLFSG